jgi:hypothetical protein
MASPRFADDLVRIPQVLAISDGDALICELADRRRFGVPVTWVALASEVQRPGDYGTLVIPRQLAQNLGLDGDGR